MKTKHPEGLSDVKKRIKGLLIEQQRAMVCALVGHSRIVTACFGYINCGRCGEQIADKLGGSGYVNAETCVQIGHNCDTCRTNFAAMGWHDKFLTPDPFALAEKEGGGDEHAK